MQSYRRILFCPGDFVNCFPEVLHHPHVGTPASNHRSPDGDRPAKARPRAMAQTHGSIPILPLRCQSTRALPCTIYSQQGQGPLV